MTRTPRERQLRRQTFGAIVLILVQSAVGMDVNLFVTIPTKHAGASPTNYLSGSLNSLGWAFGHGAFLLVLHTALGLLLAIFVVHVVVEAFRLHHGSIRVAALLGALLTIGAGLNGLSFLDYNKDASSFIMALLAFGAALSFLYVLYLLPHAGRSSATADPVIDS